MTRPNDFGPRTPAGEASADGALADSTADRGPDPLPATLRSPRTKLVYMYLRGAAGAPLEELKRALGMQALALYPVLQTLVEEGLVTRDGERYDVTGTAER